MNYQYVLDRALSIDLHNLNLYQRFSSYLLALKKFLLRSMEGIMIGAIVVRIVHILVSVIVRFLMQNFISNTVCLTPATFC